MAWNLKREDSQDRSYDTINLDYIFANDDPLDQLLLLKPPILPDAGFIDQSR